MAILEEQGKQNLRDHASILEELKCLSKKIDEAITGKADKSELNKTNNRLWAIFGTMAAAFIGVVAFLLESHFK